MARNQIDIPIALRKGTNSLVYVKDVPNGLACNCYCASCEGSLIAVNQEIKQKAHFRHDGNPVCDFNSSYESYIHWLAKEVFKTMDRITLPAIHLGAVADSHIHNQFVVKVKNILKRAGIYNHLPENQFYFPNLCLQSKQEIQISKVVTKKHYVTESGSIRVDIVIELDGQELFIEPFFTNTIDQEKFSKIASLKKPTISINLLSFVERNGHFFTIEEFKTYLGVEVAGKAWVWIRENKINKLIDDLFRTNFENAVSLAKKTLESNKKIEEELQVLDNKIRDLFIIRSELEKELIEVKLRDIIRGAIDGDFNS